jgi:hypothetical protein
MGNKLFPRQFGELAARSKAALVGKNPEQPLELLKEFLGLFHDSLEYFPKENSRSIRLSYLIQGLKFATSIEDVKEVAMEGLKDNRLQVLHPSEVERWRKDERKSLLVYLPGSAGRTEVYAPRDPQNDGDRALVVSLRITLGRLQNSSKKEE